MKKLLFVLLLVMAHKAPAQPITGEQKPVSDSVAILYRQGATGSMEMACTATAFAKDGLVTKFLTAAHCVTKVENGILGAGGKLALVREPFYLSFDDPNQKDFTKVEILEVGKLDEGYDYAILTAKLPKAVRVIPLGDETRESSGAAIVNVAAPMGIGRVYFTGAIALLNIDRPVLDEDQHINWMGAMLVQLPAEGGSSGSAIVSVRSGEIVGIVVGTMRKLTIAVPVSRVSPKDKKMIFFPDSSPAAAK